MNLEALKQAKSATGLTIAQIAERAGLPKGTVQNIFCGYVPNPRSDTLEAIERALGLDKGPERDSTGRSCHTGLPILIHEHADSHQLGLGQSGETATEANCF